MDIPCVLRVMGTFLITHIGLWENTCPFWKRADAVSELRSGLLSIVGEGGAAYSSYEFKFRLFGHAAREGTSLPLGQ